MITTVTLNPSIDRRYMINQFKTDGVFRTSSYEATAGGKGLNVARVVSCLGESVLATGLLGGKSGEFIQQKLDESNVSHSFLNIDGETRSCIAILSNNGEQTEILESGPRITQYEVNTFLNHYQDLVQRSSIIVASGSTLPGMPTSIYKDLIKIAKQHKRPFLLDTSGIPLQEGIKEAPTVIKPNLHELEGIMGRQLITDDDVIQAATQLSKNGIEYVIISLGEKGAVVINYDRVYRISIPKVEVRNPVGSGDSMIAGFAVGLLRKDDVVDVLKLAAACGTANAMEAGTGFLNPDQVASLINQVKIDVI